MVIERPPRRLAGTARLARPGGSRTAARSVVAIGGQRDGEATEAAIRRVLAAGGPQMVFQPQLSLTELTVSGYEALARFPGDHPAPGPWFALARHFCLGAPLEAAALVNAFAAAGQRPADTTVAVNVSPAVLTHPAVQAALPADLTGFEIELTEQAAGLEAVPLRALLEPLRERGARLAIDDIGTAYSGLRRVVELAPDALKLDRQLVTGVSRDSAKAALIRAVVDFAAHIDADVCAEGVESVADLVALGDLGVGFAQGWVVGAAELRFAPARPEAVEAGAGWLRRSMVGRLDHVGSHQPARAGRRAGESIEVLVCRLAGCADPAELTGCIDQITAVLGCDRCEVSWGADVPQQVQLEPSGRLVVPVDDAGRTVGRLICVMPRGRAWSGRQIRTARLIASVIASVRGRLGPVGLEPVGLEPARDHQDPSECDVRQVARAATARVPC